MSGGSSLQALGVARAWLGTPYVHQASVQGVGADCLGLVRGIWRALYGREPEPAPAYTPDWAETTGAEALWAAALRHLRPAGSGEAPGQVLLFRMREGAIAKHLGILAEVDARSGAGTSFVHAYDRHGVVESPLSAPWRSRVVARFDWPAR